MVARGRPRRDRAGASGSGHPRERDRLAAVLEVEDLAVATSGEYERGAHILDPHTGRPPAGLLSVTVAARISRAPTPTRPPPSRWARTDPAWTATLAGYDAMCVTGADRVLATPGFRPPPRAVRELISDLRALVR